MKIFVAGASGAIGARLVPALVQHGHEVVGTTRTPAKTERLRQLGAEPVVLDALDEVAVKDAVAVASPEVVVHELTDIPDTIDPRKLDQQFAATNRLRTEGMDHLLEASRAAGVRRFVAQSFGAWVYARTGGPVKVETDAMETDPPSSVRQTLAAILHVERALTEATDVEGIALRYGGFYGPGTSMGEGAAMLEMIRKRRFPIVGGGTGVWSFVHIDDAAAATVAAIEGGPPGIYNVTDDAPDACVARTSVRRGDRRGDDDQRAWRLEREGQSRAGVATAVRLLAGGLPYRAGVTSVGGGGPGDRGVALGDREALEFARRHPAEQRGHRDHPVEVGDERDALPLPEVLEPHLEVVPRGAGRHALPLLEHEDDPNLLAAVPDLFDGGHQHVAVVGCLDLSGGLVSEDAFGQAVDRAQHGAERTAWASSRDRFAPTMLP